MTGNALSGPDVQDLWDAWRNGYDDASHGLTRRLEHLSPGEMEAYGRGHADALLSAADAESGR